MFVRDVMTAEPVCCVSNSTVQDAASLMAHNHVGYLPVIAALDQRLLGVITDRDICLRIVAAGLHASAIMVRLCTTPDPVVCHPDDDLRDALRLMHDNSLRRLPVVDLAGQVVGVISLADVVNRSDVSLAELRNTFIDRRAARSVGLSNCSYRH